MSGDRHDVDSRIVLPAGMELVVPPVASDPASERDGGCDGGVPTRGPAASGKRSVFPPFVHRGELREAPAL